MPPARHDRRFLEHRFGEGHKQVRAWELARVTAGFDDTADRPDFASSTAWV